MYYIVASDGINECKFRCDKFGIDAANQASLVPDTMKWIIDANIETVIDSAVEKNLYYRFCEQWKDSEDELKKITDRWLNFYTTIPY